MGVNSMCLKNHEFTFFFDESEKYNVVPLEKKTISVRSKIPMRGEHFVGVFLGIETSKLDDLRGSFQRFEDSMKELYKRGEKDEIKSTIISPKSIANGIASFNPKLLRMYTEIFDILNACDAYCFIAYISSSETIVNGLFSGLILNGNMTKHDFINSIVRYFREYTDKQFFDDIAKFHKGDENDFKKYLIEHMRKTHRSLRGPETSDYKRNIPKVIKSIRSADFKLNVQSCYIMPYELSFQWFQNGLRITDIGMEQCILYIDGKDPVYSEDCIGPIDHESIDSMSEICIRICDLIAGFFSRLLKAIEYEIWGKQKEPDEKSLSDKWFQLDRDRFELYMKIHTFLELCGEDAFIGTLYADVGVIMHALIGSIASYGSWEEYSKVDPHEHAEEYVFVALGMLEKRMIRADIIEVANEDEIKDIVHSYMSQRWPDKSG